MPRNKNKKHKSCEHWVKDHDQPIEKLSSIVSPKHKNKKKNKIKSHTSSEFTQLLDQLLPTGLSIRKVTSDNNSLFRAIADQLNGNENNHHAIRNQITQYMISNRNEFSPFYIGDFIQYLSKMIQNGTQGGNMELTAAAKYYKIDIVIHQLNVARYEILYTTGKPQRSIHLALCNRRDYASVRLLNDMHNFMPAKPIQLDNNNEREHQRAEIASYNDKDKSMNVNDKQLEMKNNLSENISDVQKMKNDIMSDGIICPCGHKNEKDWVFCTNCGWDLRYQALPGGGPVVPVDKNMFDMSIVNNNAYNLCLCGSGKKSEKCCLKQIHMGKSWKCNMCLLVNAYSKSRCEGCSCLRDENNNKQYIKANEKCKCGSGKKYKKCCKKLLKNKFKYVGNENDNAIADFDMSIRNIQREINEFKGKRKHKNQMMKQLKKKKKQRNELVKMDNILTKLSDLKKVKKKKKKQISKQKDNGKDEKKDEELVIENDESKSELIDVIDKNKYIMKIDKMQQEIDSLKVENERLKEQRMDNKVNMEKECVFCMDECRTFAFIPCGHLCLCFKCKDLAKETCPICQNKYSSLIRIYS